MADNVALLTRDWLTKASHDLQNARIIRAAPDGPLDTAIYHCQQAAEKSLKGWLAWQNKEQVKTHDLNLLITDAADINPDFAKLRKAAEILTPYVSAFVIPVWRMTKCRRVGNLMLLWNMPGLFTSS